MHLSPYSKICAYSTSGLFAWQIQIVIHYPSRSFAPSTHTFSLRHKCRCVHVLPYLHPLTQTHTTTKHTSQSNQSRLGWNSQKNQYCRYRLDITGAVMAIMNIYYCASTGKTVLCQYWLAATDLTLLAY